MHSRKLLAGLAGLGCSLFALTVYAAPTWTAWVSEETGPALFWSDWISEEVAPVDFGHGQMVTGVECRGGYCDDMSFRVCTFNP